MWSTALSFTTFTEVTTNPPEWPSEPRLPRSDRSPLRSRLCGFDSKKRGFALGHSLLPGTYLWV